MYSKIRQYFKQREAVSRFDNTEPFALDDSIRVVVDEEDLAVIHHPDVKAVLWRRAENPEIMEDLKKIETSAEGFSSGRQIKKETNNSVIYGGENTPDSIVHEVAEVNNAFNSISLDTYNSKINYFGSAVKSDRASHVHVDNNFTLRALACYTLDINAATQFYPGDFTREEIDHINEELEGATSVEERSQIRESHGVQSLNLNEVLITKGANYDDTIGVSDQLAHNGPEEYDGDVFRYLSL